jgi:hypothetical protein
VSCHCHQAEAAQVVWGSPQKIFVMTMYL